VLGLDALDPRLAAELADAGRLPNIARLMGDGAQAAVHNPYGLFVGALWPTIATGLSAEKVDYHSWIRVDPSSYERRLTTHEFEGRPFWRAVSDAGRRIAVLDVPHDRAGEPVNGIEVSEWGCHDRHFGLRSSPPEIAAELTRGHGLHPVLGIDPYAERHFAPDDEYAREGLVRTADEDRQLTDGLLAGLEAKRRLAIDVLEREPWDLYFCVFGESHAAGHHFWHHHDRDHPRHDPEAAALLDDPMIRIYEALDAAVGEHLERCGDETTFALLLSHGMSSHHDGTHLLEEVLRRLDGFYESGPGGRAGARLAKRALLSLPGASRRAMRRPAAAAVRRALAGRELVAWWGEHADHDWSRQRWFLSPNNTVYGGVRLNVRGREAAGTIEPGAGFERACEQLAADLLELVNVETGEPVIHGVSRTDEHYARNGDDALPDLLLDWNHERPVTTIWSAKTGLIHGAYDLWRTGDHRLEGLLLARGPGIAPGPKPPLRSIDLAPSLAARLDVELEDADGVPVEWLAG
jgi:predicted AlkP superfamily phosphohydrolase/phosphomutase